MICMKVDTIKPILRWAGGKTWLVPKIGELLPANFGDYYEPFLGGGAVYFNVEICGNPFLSDTNGQLINAYKVIRDRFEDLCKQLGKYNNTKEEYYEVREKNYTDCVNRAAQFMYLNRTCFNGIYRVNKMGKFNVPYGFKEYKILFDFRKLKQISSKLRKAKLATCDFEETNTTLKKGDLVFLDPPYTVAARNNGFLKYNEKIFSWEDQRRLAKYVDMLKRKDIFFILTNAKHESIFNLFGSICEPISVSRHSVIGGLKAKRGLVEEYVFTNCLKSG
ncbi:MAG: Dam family site-specific DNA-(adenine-N6)-methyltransferase [Candidatus Glassbacteria bacterium]|nr:Dam family site-specific DNA-(adenine-N6)-methyltransferase [Candidatus Glassbacteria bacterium]